MFFGGSGYDYAADIACESGVEVVSDLIVGFYLSAGAKLMERTEARIVFKRGEKKGTVNLETNQPQTISVDLGREPESTRARIHYHVHSEWGAVIWSSGLTKEVARLRKLLNTEREVNQ
jgi:hypothetical protein